MARMIIAGVSETSRDQMTRLLASSGYSVYRCCSSGSSLRRALAESEDSILIYLGLFPDCRPEELVWVIIFLQSFIFLKRERERERER